MFHFHRDQIYSEERMYDKYSIHYIQQLLRLQSGNLPIGNRTETSAFF